MKNITVRLFIIKVEKKIVFVSRSVRLGENSYNLRDEKKQIVVKLPVKIVHLIVSFHQRNLGFDCYN